MTDAKHVFIFSREYPPVTVGGTSTVARNLAVGLAKLRWQVTVITTRPQASDDSHEEIDGVFVHRIVADVVYNTDTGLVDQSIRMHRRMYSAAERLAQTRGVPDLVALPDLFCYPEAAMFGRRHGLPMINILLQDFRAITPYDRDTHRVTSGVSASHEHLVELEEKAFRTSSHTVFISRALSDAVTGYYPDVSAPSSVVHLGIDLAEVDAVAADGQWATRRARLMAGHRGPLLVACGRLVPVKGFAVLLRALAALDLPAEGAAPPVLALVGVGPEEPHLRKLADDLGLAERVEFLGDVSRQEALGWMSVADVAVVPSLWESFCYVCAEMMAMGRPVVASSVDSLRELIPSEEFGYPVPVSGPSGDRHLRPEDLASRISAALANPDDARRRGEAARGRICATFTNKRFAEGVAAVADTLVAVHA